MSRAMQVGMRIQYALEENPDRVIYPNKSVDESIITEIAHLENLSESTIIDDYQSRFLPIWQESLKKAELKASKYPFSEES